MANKPQARVIVCGGRNFNDRGLLCRTLDIWIPRLGKPLIVTGGAKGADTLAEEWAHTNSHYHRLFIADWVRHKKAAGHIRNADMAKFVAIGPKPGYLIAFWDGRSPGTADMIDHAINRGFKRRIIYYPLVGAK